MSKLKNLKGLLASVLALSFVGIFDSGYLTLKHYDTSIPLKCTFFNGCDFVLNSKYSIIFGLPASLYGLIFYLLVFSLALVFLFSKKSRRDIIPSLFSLSILGVSVSGYFLYLQFIVLKSICFYCLISAVTSTLIFVLALIALRVNREKAK